MKLFRNLGCSILALAAVAVAGVNPELHQVKRVYILSMGSGMDQYLATQLAKSGLFEVVTDPKRADAIVSDSVGEPFQRKLDELYPPPPQAKPELAKPAADVDPSAPPVRRNVFEGVDFSGGGPRSSSFGRGKGNFFVVGRNSRAVLWSVYERPKNSTPGQLTKTAQRIVHRLKDDLADNKKSESN